MPFLHQFFAYFNSSAILTGVRDVLLEKGQKYNVRDKVDRILSEDQWLYGETEEEAAAIGWQMLVRLVNEGTDFQKVLTRFARRAGGQDINGYLEFFRDEYLEPFYEYVDEHLDDQHVILYLLKKYKHRCEWFQASRLRQMITGDTIRGEKEAALDLYEYLHTAGVDFSIEPKGASGVPDFVTEQIGEDRIIADAKIYWPEKSKGKSYLVTGFNQILTYACDYNEPFAYLIIFNLADEDIRFLLTATGGGFPSYTYNNKTVFFVVIDIFEYGAPASKRGKRKAVDISESDLVVGS
jgi:hypothetical protein